MYRSQLDKRDKGGAMAAVVAVHAGLLFAFLNITGRIDLADPQSAIRMFDVNEIPPPPPPPPPPPQQREQAKPKEKEGGSAPKNIKSEATPVVAPKPRIVIPPLPQIATSETPREGTAPTQGAADVRGPGTGAGGVGTGTGSGAGGGGPGGGGGGGVAVRAQKLSPSLSMRDYPPHLRRRFPRGTGVLVTFTVLTNGRVTDCKVFQSSGDAEVDNMTCALVTSRFVYRPAYNGRGEPVISKAGYRQGD